MADNVISLGAFGDVIEPKGKREYKNYAPYVPEPVVGDEIIQLAPVAEPQGPVAPKKKSTGGVEKSNCVAAQGLKNIAQIKLLHWETYSYAEHIALDGLFDKMIKLVDVLTESVMGKYGRPVLTEEDRTIMLINYKTPESPDGLPEFMEALDRCYRETCPSMFNEKDDSEILNIIQEILGRIDRTKYLLSLGK